MRVKGFRATDRRFSLVAVWCGVLLAASAPARVQAQGPPLEYAGTIDCSWCGDPATDHPDVKSDADRFRNVALNCILWGKQDMRFADPVCLMAQDKYRDQILEQRIGESTSWSVTRTPANRNHVHACT